jgi:uncharacterized protein
VKILVSGSSGLIGSALVPFLSAEGHSVTRLLRAGSRAPRGSAAGDVGWDPASGRIEPRSLEGFHAVVHLAGESIAGGRWTSERKARIRESRVQGTRLLAEALAERSHQPQVLVSASAIGYYGDRGEELLKEDSLPGLGFLAEVCRDWEAATEPATKKGIRTVNLRIGVVLSAAGGALARMVPPFRAGLGGVLGSGRQYMSWIALDDVVGAIHHAMMNESLRGPVNIVAPAPVSNREFTRTLGRVLGRPTWFPAPAFVLRLAFGEMADALLLASARVSSSRLEASSYQFRCHELDDALRHVLGKGD